MTIRRPDLIDLIGPEFDTEEPVSADMRLIICSAPRTGSYELCRLLTAAGIGVPHEYFNPRYMELIGKRFGVATDPLDLPSYFNALRLRRSRNGVCAIKLQFWQFKRYLKNRFGLSLFESATAVIHLFRADVAEQFASFRAAILSGRWDFNDRITGAPQQDSLTGAMRSLDMLIAEDAGFRRLFALLGISPMFITTEEIRSRPKQVVHDLADRLGVPVNCINLDAAVAVSAPYCPDDVRKSSTAAFTEAFREEALRA